MLEVLGNAPIASARPTSARPNEWFVPVHIYRYGGYTESAEDAEGLVELADEAIYPAKATETNKVLLAEPR